MLIPETLKIGNLPYKVSIEEEENIDACGKGNMMKQYIKLNKAMPKEMQEETFLHEIIHQILSQKSFSEENKDEKLIDTLAGGLYQVLKDNGMLKENV